MKQVPFSVVRDDLDEFLDGVERGETFVITRYGKYGACRKSSAVAR
jgi:antitoxin (DNA-binding transcriptional repressor) of toxin-antitoxin stability system